MKTLAVFDHPKSLTIFPTNPTLIRNLYQLHRCSQLKFAHKSTYFGFLRCTGFNSDKGRFWRGERFEGKREVGFGKIFSLKGLIFI